jgi:hypothetical protein
MSLSRGSPGSILRRMPVYAGDETWRRSRGRGSRRGRAGAELDALRSGLDEYMGMRQQAERLRRL